MGRRRRREAKQERRGRKAVPRIHRRKHPVTIQVQGRMVRLSVRTTPVKRSGGLRGNIYAFSAQSRKRMLETIARLDWERAGFVCFVTLGYPDRDGPPSLKQFERDRQVFLKRIGRLHPKAAAIWRREHEARKSGKFVGVQFPHYHMLFFGLPFLHYTILNTIWKEVIGYEDYLRTEIEKVKSWKQALYYVAKYMGKLEVGPPLGQAAVRREADAAPEADRSLVYVAYLTAVKEAEEARKNPSITSAEWQAIKERRRLATLRYRKEEQSKRKKAAADAKARATESGREEPESIGRSWGIHNKKCLPWAKRRAIGLRAGPWLEVARHEAKKKWAGIDESENTGFTLFLDDADKFFDELVALRKPKP